MGDERKEIWISNFHLITLSVLQVYSRSQSGLIATMKYTFAKLLFWKSHWRNLREYHCAIKTAQLDSLSVPLVTIFLPAQHSPGQPQRFGPWGLEYFALKCLIRSVSGFNRMHKHKKRLCLYTIAFSAFLLIKVDSYTCWIKRNIMMMYFCCIIYHCWPGRATVPEVIRLLIHYIRQISGSLWRVFASEFYNAFICCYVTFMF